MSTSLPLWHDPILTVPEVSRYLKVSKSKIYYQISKKQIPHLRLGRNVRIRQSDLLRWISSLQIQSIEKEYDFKK